ncbi:hypothetical protein Scep_022368 [Stephania cephalantha]|uniref:Uncharacterized protein n=1 Tax=Stephania cephalantha TaxID=152367 RepID=A0AAP0I2M2_9MAGN
MDSHGEFSLVISTGIPVGIPIGGLSSQGFDEVRQLATALATAAVVAAAPPLPIVSAADRRCRTAQPLLISALRDRRRCPARSLPIAVAAVSACVAAMPLPVAAAAETPPPLPVVAPLPVVTPLPAAAATAISPSAALHRWSRAAAAAAAAGAAVRELLAGLPIHGLRVARHLQPSLDEDEDEFPIPMLEPN